MITRVTSEEGKKYLGFAQNKLTVLRELVRLTGVPAITKNFIIEGYSVTVRACAGADLISISGGMSPDIIFTGPDGGSMFNWTSREFTAIGSVGSEWIASSAPDTMYTDSGLVVNSSGSAAQAAITEKPSTYFPESQRSIWYDGSKVQIIKNSEAVEVAQFTLSGGAEIEGLEPVQSGDFAYFPVQHSSLWNQFEPVDHHIYSIASGYAATSGYWLPSLFFAAAGNGYYYNGFHYGKFGDWWESGDTEGHGLTNCKIYFGNYLENRDIGATNKYGYCEVVTELDDRELFLVTFFFQSGPLTHAGNPYDSYQSMTGTMYGGTVPTGFTYTHRMDLFDFFGKITERPNIHLWSMDTYVEDSALTVDIDASAVVISVDSKAVCYRYKGYNKKIFETEVYHSHSVSHDGKIVALFEHAVGEPDTIAYVSVYNMFNPETEVYCEGTTTPSGFTVGEVIPFSDNTAQALPFDSEGYTPVVNTAETPSLWYAPYAYIGFVKANNRPAEIHKLKIDGTLATVDFGNDECFESEVVTVVPDGNDQYAEVTIVCDGVSFTGPFNQAAGHLPKVLYATFGAIGSGVPNEICFASFSGAGDNMRIGSPAVSVSGGSKRTYTLTDTITIGRVIGGDIAWENDLGDLTFGGCLNGDGEEDADCIHSSRCANDEVEYSIASSCGQTGEYIEPNPVPARSISGPLDVTVGSDYTMSGGLGPFEWDISAGSIDEFGTVTDLTGACGTITVSTIDSCGVRTEYNVRGIGQWVAVGSDVGVSPSTTFYIIFDKITGTTKTRTTYGIDGAHYSEESSHTAASSYCQTNIYQIDTCGDLRGGEKLAQCDHEICGEASGLPITPAGSTRVDYSFLNEYSCLLHSYTNTYNLYGWKCYTPQAWVYYEWQCL